MSEKHNIVIEQGATFSFSMGYLDSALASAAITAITNAGQAEVTAAGHGIPDDWLVYVVGVSGMEINHQPRDLQRPDKAYIAYYVDANTVRLNKDTTRLGPYVSGGELLYYPPIDLTGYTARMQIRESVDSDTAIHTMTTESGGISINASTGEIALTISASDTASFTFNAAVYDLELVSPGGEVTRLLSGVATLSKEVTR